MHVRPRPSLWISAAYFAFYAGIACWAPYIVLYYKSRGLSGTEIGILSAISPLGMAFFAPAWGYVADSHRAHRLILRIALLTTATVALLLVGASSFWHMLPLILTLAIVGTTASPLIDSYGVTISAQQGVGFGQLRVWGSIGYTIVVWLIGYAMGATVSQLFLLCYAAALALTCAATFGLPAQKHRSTPDRWRGAAAILQRRDMQIVLLVIFLLAMSTYPVFSLFGIYITEIGGATSLLGSTSAIAAISEFPIMFLGARLVKRLGSRQMFIIALVVYGMRMLLYTLLPSATWVHAVQLLHGCSFGLYLIASVTMMHELVGSELAATAQGLLASAMAFGQMSGALIGGALLDRIGIVAIYRLSFSIVVVALVLFVLGLRWYGRQEARPVLALPRQHGEP